MPIASVIASVHAHNAHNCHMHSQLISESSASMYEELKIENFFLTKDLFSSCIKQIYGNECFFICTMEQIFHSGKDEMFQSTRLRLVE